MPVAQPGAWIILIVTIVFSALALKVKPGLIPRCVFRPYRFWRGQGLHTIVSSGFVHADFGHLLLNMLTLYFFAFALEKRIGTTAFLVGYLLALVFSSVPSLLKHRDDPRYATLGASGAVMAVLFAFIVLFPTSTLFILPIPVPIPALLYAFLYLAYSYYAAKRRNDGINHDAHLSGAVCGLVWIAVCVPGAYPALVDTLAQWLR